MSRTTIPVGNFSFDFVSLAPNLIGPILKDFVISGSGANKLTKKDLNIVQRSGNVTGPYTTVREAVDNGTRLFDAIAYFTLPVNKRPEIRAEPEDPDSADPSLEEIGRAMFFIYMWVMIRGSHPPLEQPEGGWKVPNLLSNIMGFRESPDVYVRRVASFDLGKINTAWVKYVPINELEQIGRNRLALGLAGYREAGALACLPFRDDAPAEAVQAANVVKRFLSRGLVWDCVSATRTEEFISTVKSFNKNCENLLVLCVSQQDLQAAVNRKMIFAMPTYNPQHQEYRSWTDETFAPFNDYIFRRDQ